MRLTLLALCLALAPMVGLHLASSPESILRRLQLSKAGTLFGAHVMRVGDVDGDGVRDLVVEEPGATGVAENGRDWKGATWVLSGATLK